MFCVLYIAGMNTVNKLLEACGSNTALHYDKWTEQHRYRALNDGNLKQWISGENGNDETFEL